MPSIVEGLVRPKHSLFFVDGFHSCGFLNANDKRARKYINTQTKIVGVNTLVPEFEKLSKGYD